MGVSISTIKAIAADLGDLKTELKEVRTSMKENSKELSILNKAIATEQTRKQQVELYQTEVQISELGKYPLVKSADPVIAEVVVVKVPERYVDQLDLMDNPAPDLDQADMDLIFRKLDII